MSEIYRNSIGKGITLNIPGVTVTSAVIKRGDQTINGTVSDNAVAVPFSITSSDGPFTIDWSFVVEGQTQTIQETHEVVTPLFTKDDLAYDTHGLGKLTDDEVKRLESLIRKVIEAHTGQSFGLRKGYLYAYGKGGNVLKLSERIAELTDKGYRVSNDGFSIVSPVSNGDGYNIKVPAEEEALYNSLHGYPTTNYSFKEGLRYKVSGSFGWSSVPQDIKEAALLLAEQFSCNESLWRDRYLRAISAADWRFDFQDAAFVGTGSVSADQLLAKYTVTRAVVI